MTRLLGNISCDVDAKVKESIFIVNASGNISCDLDAKVKECIFIVNASPPKPLEIATSNFAGAYVT